MEIRTTARVLGFDSWAGGAHHYQRLVQSFRDKGLDLRLVHIGSWGSDKGRPPKELLEGLPVRDISSYASSGFEDILESEKPSAVIFLSTDTFAHRAFNRYCRQRRIPTVNLYNGLASVQLSSNGSCYRISYLAQLRFVLIRIPKAIRHIWPIYMRALWKTGATMSEWLRFAQDIVAGVRGKFWRSSAPDARTDVCCVYVDADREHAIRKYGFERADVIPVGNPDLSRFGLRSDMIGRHSISPQGDRWDVMYIDTGLIYTGFMFNSSEEFIQHIVHTKEQLALQGRHLILKPHPDHARTNVQPRLIAAGIDITSNADFVARLQSCCASIVESSTLSVLPALMGMPVFLAQYGKLNGQAFGEMLTSYPRAVPLPAISQFTALLAGERSNYDADRTKRWIEENAGPLPAEDMPQRVAQIVATLVLNRRNSESQTGSYVGNTPDD